MGRLRLFAWPPAFCGTEGRGWRESLINFRLAEISWAWFGGLNGCSLGFMFNGCSFSTCQVRVVGFYQSFSSSPPRLPPPLRLRRLLSVSSSSSSSPASCSKWQITVGTAGPQLQVRDRSGHCRTSTANHKHNELSIAAVAGTRRRC